MHLISGLFVTVFAAFINGSFMAPMKFVLKAGICWEWEHVWFLYSIFATFLYPWMFFLFFVPLNEFGNCLAKLSFSGWFLPVLFALLWGGGSAGFGIGINLLGLSLGAAIILGITTSVGSLGLMIVTETKQLFKLKGLLAFLAVLVMLFSLIALSYAGWLRDNTKKNLKSKKKAEKLLLKDHQDEFSNPSESFYDEERKQANKKNKALYGLLICLLSGIGSSMLNFALAFGGNELGSCLETQSTLSQVRGSIAVWAFSVGTGGFLGNVVYPIFLLQRAPSEGKIGWYGLIGQLPPQIGSSRLILCWLFVCGLMSGAWYIALVIYGFGSVLLDDPPLCWPIFMGMTVLISNLWGIIFGEWKNTFWKERCWMLVGLIFMLISLCLVGLGLHYGDSY